MGWFLENRELPYNKYQIPERKNVKESKLILRRKKSKLSEMDRLKLDQLVQFHDMEEHDEDNEEWLV
jgi:hypothetical protein